MAVRMQSVKAGEIDETGMSLNNVEKTLSRIGIDLRDSADSFRPLEDVIGDVAKVWGTLDEVTKAQISNAIAGQRQAQIFAVLMQNFGDVEKYVTAETNSLGLATDRYSIYLENAEAAQNRLRASWEKLVQGAISSGAIAGVYDTLSGILGLMDKMGGIPAILGVVITSFIAFNGVAALTSAGIFGIADAWAALSLAFATNPIGWVVLALGAAVLAFNYFYENASEKLEKLNSEIDEHTSKINKLRDSARSISELTTEYKKLSEEYKKTGVMSQEFFDVQNKLKELVPSLSGHFDEYGNFILDASNDMATLNRETLEQIRLEKELRQSKIDESSEVTAKGLIGIQKKKSQYDLGYLMEGNRRGRDVTESEKIQVNLDWSNALEDSKAAFSEMSIEAKKSFIQTLEDSGSGDIAKIFSDMLGKEGIGGLSPDDRDEIANEAKSTGQFIAETAYAGFTETLQGLVDTSSTVDNLLTKSMEGTLSLGDAAKIPPEYLDALTVQGDKLKINIDLLKQMQIEHALNALEATKEAEAAGLATAQQTQIVQFAYDQLIADSQRTFGAFNQTAWQYDALLWQIANDAVAAGYTFKDMEGNALTSAQSIYQNLAASDANFNNFAVGLAQATGRSVAEVMSVINSMVAQSIDNTTKAMQYAHLMREYGQNPNAGLPSAPSISGNLFSGFTPSSGGGGGGGGGGRDTSARERRQAEREREEQERLRQIEQDIADARSEAIDDLKDQLSIYKDITDERKKQLDIAADERQYNQDVEEKNKEILRVQTELNALQFDNSEEANARRLALEDELSNLNQDLENIQYDQSVEVQKNAIDAEYDAFRTQIEAAIRAIEDISAGSVEGFAAQLAAVLTGLSVPAGVPAFHSGGVVGSSSGSVGSNEVLAKLLEGEVVATQAQADNFVRNTLPQLAEASSTINGGNMEISIPIQVMGNLDRAALPGLEAMVKAAVKQINENMSNRGYTRRADSFSV